MQKRKMLFKKGTRKRFGAMFLAFCITAGTIQTGDFLSYAAENSSIYEVPDGEIESISDAEDSAYATVEGNVSGLNVKIKGSAEDIGNIHSVEITTMETDRVAEYQKILDDRKDEYIYHVLGVYDIKLLDITGTEQEPQESVHVTLGGKDIENALADSGDLLVFHNQVESTENVLQYVNEHALQYVLTDNEPQTAKNEAETGNVESISDAPVSGIVEITENSEDATGQDTPPEGSVDEDAENMDFSEVSADQAEDSTDDAENATTALLPTEKRLAPVTENALEEMDAVVSDGNKLAFVTSSFSEYAIVQSELRDTGLKLSLGTTGNQVETKLHDKTYLEMDKYLSEATGEMNGQDTYNLYLEQALADLDHPDSLENPAPAGMNVIMIIDQSSSMANDEKLSGTNNATKAFFSRLKKLNAKRIANGKAGKYTNIDPDGDVEAQMSKNLIRVTGILGYNNHLYYRYRNVNGMVVNSDAAVTQLSNASKLKNDLADYLAGNDNADMQEMTRTDLALEKAEDWINEEGTPEKSYVVLLTDGRPTIADKSGWHQDLESGIIMSSINANNSLRAARRMKDAGVIIDGVYIEWDGGDLSRKAMQTGNIDDVADQNGWGMMATFLSLVSSDYPKNGTFGVNGRMFDGTYSYEPDPRNCFGAHIALAESLADVNDQTSEVIPPKIEAASVARERTGYASSGAIVQDTISMPFEVQTGADVKVYKVPRIPANLGDDGIPKDMNDKYEVSDFRWGTEKYVVDGDSLSEWEDITDEISVSVNGSTIRVTGYDYEKNAVVNFDKDTAKKNMATDATVYHPGDYGWKLVVIVPINAKVTFGGNQIATNNSDSTYFLPSNPTGRSEGEADYLPPWIENDKLNPTRRNYVEKYPLPIVDLHVTYKIVSDNLTVYAPQTAEIHNLVTDANNLLWYADDAYYDLKTAAAVAKSQYEQAAIQFDTYEVEYGKIENPTSADLQKLMDLETAKGEKLSAYQKAQEELSTALYYAPDGINNQFVDILYELKDPDDQVIATMHIPHGKAYVEDSDGKGNINWTIDGGSNAIVTKSGTYKITATVTPVDTDRAPGGLVYTGLDSESMKQTIGYSSEMYSATGSKAQGSESAITVTESPTAHLFQLKIKTGDTRLTKKQALDFIAGGEDLMTTSNVHILGYEWICTDGQTASVKEEEPGITGLMKVGGGVTIISQIPEAAEQEGLVEDINGTTVVGAEDGAYVPVSVILSRNIGNLNKSVSATDQATQVGKYLTDNDEIWGAEHSSVIWEHNCGVITDWECNDNEFTQAQKYNTAEDASGRGQVQYLIHVMDNPLPNVTKATSTPYITKGADIKWTVSVDNSNESQNPHRRTAEFSLVDVLPYVGDGRIDPNTNREGSQFGGSLKYETISADFSNAPKAFQAYQDGKAVFYYTTETAVRKASESQMLGDAKSGNISWTQVDGAVNGNNISFAVPANAVAFRMTLNLAWQEKITYAMTANVTSLGEQKKGDYYHNQAMVFAGNGIRTSNVVATEVSSLYISGTVWADTDSNGLMSAEEERIPDVVVTLYTPYNSKNPNPVDRTVNGVKLSRAYNGSNDLFAPYATQEDGAFSFDDVPAGTYYLVADYIPDRYSLTTKRAGKGDSSLEAYDSEAEESFVDTSADLAHTAWIKEIVVESAGVPNQNIGLREIRGNVTVGKVLDEIYYPSNMGDEDKEDYRVSFIFVLKNRDTGAMYREAVYLDGTTIHAYQGKPQVTATFKDIPLGTYELSEVSEAQYVLKNITSTSNSVTFDKAAGVATIPVTATEHEFELLVENALDRTPPGGDENGVKNHIGMHIPVKLEITYVGPDPISSSTLTSYKFTASDFSPAKGGDIVVTYDDGSTISLSKGTLDFSQITLTPGTVTNRMNSGNKKIAVAGYYSEKGRTVKDTYRVKVDLKPVHKFQLNFDANTGRFETGSQTNSVLFGYDDNTGKNYVIKGTYRDTDNGGMWGPSGFSFGGWNSKPDGSGQQYDTLDALNAVGKDSNISELTLYANWKTRIYFDAQGGTMYDGTTNAEKALNGKGSGSIVVSLNQSISTTLKAQKTNNHFVLWNTQTDALGTNIQNYGTVKKANEKFYAIYYVSYYSYTGGQQVFKAPVSGWYSFALTGASGGGENQAHTGGSHIGWGGTSKGMIWMKANTYLYVYVGGRGTAGAGYNGGGTSPGYNGVISGGGGATDLRLAGDGNWSHNLDKRIIVAGGGGGSDDALTNSDGTNNGCGGDGGGLSGTYGYADGSPYAAPGTQNSGYAKGYGGNGTFADAGGGGGGFWGGYGAGNNNNGGGGGGSGYVSGMSGCASATGGYYCKNASMQTGTWYGNGYAEVVLQKITSDPNSSPY